jgi:Domain of unknown function (DUF4249)
MPKQLGACKDYFFMTNFFLKYGFPLLFSAVIVASCNLTRDVEIELPEYDRQPVVECYLEPDKPFRLLLTQSYAFFDAFGLDSTFLEKTIIQGAQVTITYDGKTERLTNQFSFEVEPLKIFNYTGRTRVPATPGIRYTLNIVLPDGRTITGETVMLKKVPIDSVVTDRNPQRDTLLRALTYFTDDLTQRNFYRRMLHYKSLDSLPQQDFTTNDRLSTTALVAFGTGYELKQGDTIFNTLFHIEQAYYDYYESVQLAVAGNLSPFAQPSRIRSNLSGTANPVGIFTPLVYDRVRTIVGR